MAARRYAKRPEVRETDGPSPTQDGPHHGTQPALDDMGYLDVSGEMYSYLEHFRKPKFLEEGHNVSSVPVAGRGPSRRPSAPARSQGSVTGTSRPVAGRRY